MADIFGTGTDHLNALQMAARAGVVFATGLVCIRTAGLRTLGKMTAFDQLTLLVIGSILGRSVVTGMEFWGALLSVAIIVFLQRLISWLTFKSHRMGIILKGRPLFLISNRIPQKDNLSSAFVTEEDVKEALRTQLQREDLNSVKDAVLERSGHISFVEEEKNECQ